VGASVVGGVAGVDVEKARTEAADEIGAELLVAQMRDVQGDAQQRMGKRRERLQHVVRGFHRVEGVAHFHIFEADAHPEGVRFLQQALQRLPLQPSVFVQIVPLGRDAAGVQHEQLRA